MLLSSPWVGKKNSRVTFHRFHFLLMKTFIIFLPLGLFNYNPAIVLCVFSVTSDGQSQMIYKSFCKVMKPSCFI